MNQQRDTFRYPESPITEWRGVRIEVRISHPALNDTITYAMVHDSRLVPIGRLSPPLDRDDHIALLRFQEAREVRRRFTEVLAGQLATAIEHALEKVDGDWK